MITPSFSPTATERVLPKLALDFTTASLDSRVTFTRTTNATNPATYINSSGYVTAATDNQPRFDYNPITLACNGLLIEESRANALTYSEDFSNGAWVKANINTSGTPPYVDVAVSPSNIQNADKIIPNTTNGAHSVYQNYTATNTTLTFSVFLKAAEFKFVTVQISNSSTGAASVQFNTLLGTITSPASNGGDFTATSATITNYGNGWYRCTITTTKGAVNNLARPYLVLFDNSGNYTYAGDGTSGVYMWGAQMEVGAFPTSYIPTTSTALTRNADVATMTGTNFSDWYNATQGSFVTTFDTRYPIGGGTGIAILADTSAVIWPTYIHSTGKAAMYDGTNLALTSGNVPAYPTVSKIATRYGSSEQAVSLNGSTRATSASVGYAGLSGLRLGSATSNIVPLSGHIQKMFYYSVKFTDDEMKAFST